MCMTRSSHKPLKLFGFAGSKDKSAITTQTCSAKGTTKDQIEKLKLKDIKHVLGMEDLLLSKNKLEEQLVVLRERILDEKSDENCVKARNELLDTEIRIESLSDIIDGLKPRTKSLKSELSML